VLEAVLNATSHCRNRQILRDKAGTAGTTRIGYVMFQKRMLPSIHHATKLSIKNDPTIALLNTLGVSCHTFIFSLPDIIMSFLPQDEKQAYGKGVITFPLVV
jgi:amino acid transporter